MLKQRLAPPVSRENPLNVLNVDPQQIEKELFKEHYELLPTEKNRASVNDCLKAILEEDYDSAFTHLAKIESQTSVNRDHPRFLRRVDLYLSCLMALTSQLAFGESAKLLHIQNVIETVKHLPVWILRIIDISELDLIKNRVLLALVKQNGTESSAELAHETAEKFRMNMPAFFHFVSLEAPDLLQDAFLMWPEVDAPLAVELERNPFETKMAGFLNSDKSLSYTGLCKFISETGPTSQKPVYEVYDLLPESEKHAFMEKYLSNNTHRQKLVEKYMDSLHESYAKPLALKNSAFAFTHSAVLEEWHQAVVEQLKGHKSLAKFSALFSAFSPQRLTSFVLSRMVHGTLLSGGIKTSTLTTELARGLSHFFNTEPQLKKIQHQFQVLFPQEERIRFFAAMVKVVISTCYVPNTTKKAFALELLLYPDANQLHKTGTITIHTEVRRLFEKHHDRLSFDSYDLPMLCPPRKWLSPTHGGFLNNRKPFLVTEQSAVILQYMKRAHKTGQLSSVYSALTEMGNCGWAVNSKMLSVFNEAIKQKSGFLSIPPSLEQLQETVPIRPKKSDFVDLEEYKRAYLQYKRESTTLKKTTVELRSLRQTFELKNQLLNALGKNGDIFYFVHAVDFRGRTYPLSSLLSHHNDDLSRSLLMFWEAKPLGDTGYAWLCYQLANLYSKTKMTMEQLAVFVQENKQNIIRSAQKPFEESWWAAGDTPWQSLALCQELAAIWEFNGPISEFRSRIPVHQDGTCNGLQHYAALGRDEIAAKSVNLEPGQTKADVYLDVLEVVREKVQADIGNPEFSLQAKVALPLLTRKVLKQTVMTTVYGVTFYGAIRQINEHIPEIPRGEKDHRFDQISQLQISTYIATKVMHAIAELFSKARAIQEWLGSNCRRHLYAFTQKPPDFLNRQLKRPMMWTSLSGFPVVQPYLKQTLRHLRTVLQDISMRQDYLFDNIDKLRQLNGVAPNYIHSIDAMHLQMVCLAAAQRKLTFAAVHDSFWTHAAGVPQLSEIIRKEFVRLHSSEPLENLRDDLLYANKDSWQLVWMEKAAEPELAEKLAKLRAGKDVNEALQAEFDNNNAVLKLLDHHKPQLWFQPVKSKIDCELYSDQFGKPETKKLALHERIPVLVPVKIIETPPVSTFDLNRVLKSTFFFS